MLILVKIAATHAEEPQNPCHALQKKFRQNSGRIRGSALWLAHKNFLAESR